ncbi:MAG: alpha/beta hydrolase [Bacteroidetes bacterium]|nr:MAG: alpha/beta hydrolase [Bacteroidota bacterium]
MQFKNISLVFLLSFSIFIFIACTDDGNLTDPIIEVVDTDTAFTKTIEFASEDDLIITADHYHVKNNLPVIVLCHQANWSRGEYAEIAPKLNALGFNCIAIDQRSGGTINGVDNETTKRASNAGKGTAFNDAKQDINAAIAKAKELYDTTVILWGSSYSSALALIVATENENVEQVLSFSPGEYLGTVKVGESITSLDKPAFLTSSKSEGNQTKELFDVIPSDTKIQFVPNGNGEHGSRALWEDKADNAEYWVAVKAFLGK